MAGSSQLVKELREKTGAGILDCQKALTENVFNLMSFIKSEGRWVKAHEIAQEGIQEAVADLHGKLNLARAERRFPGGSIEEYKAGILRYERKEATQ